MLFLKPFLIALPALALAEEQAQWPLRVKGWFSKVQAYIPAAFPTVQSPTNAGASQLAEKLVVNLTQENWRDIVTPSVPAVVAGPEEWLIYLTGGNKTCSGLCGNTTEAWNKSIPPIAASRKLVRLGKIDCDVESLLCSSWAASPPLIMHVLLPTLPSTQPTPAATVRFIALNKTSTTAADIAGIVLEHKFKETKPYTGIFHPFEGLLVRYKLATPVAYVIWGFSRMPSWMPMITFTILSRVAL